MIKGIRSDRQIGLVFAVLLLSFLTVIHGYLALQFSLWSDELAAIAPALRPWRGDQNFWWQIKQYFANPPGENLILRLIYKAPLLASLRESSPEFFWRLPYIVAYFATGFLTYVYVQKWSRSALIASVALVFFVISPGPFAYATETRFYIWAILWMTVAIWELLFFIRSDFSRRNLVRVSVAAFVGVLFHVSLALVCYLLVWLTIFTVICELLPWVKEQRLRQYPQWRKLLGSAALGFLPYLMFRYEKRYWMWVPETKITVAHIWSALSQSPATISENFGRILPFSLIWIKGGYYLLSGMVLFMLVRTIRRRDKKGVISSLVLAALLMGGPFMVYLSTSSIKLELHTRHFLFAVPIVIACLFHFSRFIPFERFESVPLIPRTILIGALMVLGGSLSVSMAKENLRVGSPAKINYDLKHFREYYSLLPDRRKLVLVGVGEGELGQTTDSGSWLGSIFQRYTAGFEPLFLTSRESPNWPTPSTPGDWKQYDFLIFVPYGKEPKAAGLDWALATCKDYPWQVMRFCRL